MIFNKLAYTYHGNSSKDILMHTLVIMYREVIMEAEKAKLEQQKKEREKARVDKIKREMAAE